MSSKGRFVVGKIVVTVTESFLELTRRNCLKEHSEPAEVLYVGHDKQSHLNLDTLTKLGYSALVFVKNVSAVDTAVPTKGAGFCHSP